MRRSIRDSNGSPGWWDRLEELFEAASALPEAERTAFLNRACAGDAPLRAELDSLLAFTRSDDPGGAALPQLLRAASTDLDDDPLIGRTIAHYTIEARLGSGGMGVVYRAHDTRLDRAVALKFVSTALGRDPAAKTRFLVEARAAAAIDHPNVCAIHEIGEAADDGLFIAMPYYEGETLKQRLARGPLTPGEALNIVMETAEGVMAAHAHGILHRDIKPGNILIPRSGVVKLLDFGIAKKSEVVPTQDSTIIGSLAYMSPEQLAGEPLDVRTDVWSLGVVLYEALTSVSPFARETHAHTLRSVLFEEPKAISTLRPDAPAALDGIVRRMLARPREVRYDSVRACMTDLRLAADVTGQRAARRPSFPDDLRRTRMRRFVKVGAFASAVSAVLLMFALGEPAGGSRPIFLVTPEAADTLALAAAQQLTDLLNDWQPTVALPWGAPPATPEPDRSVEREIELARQRGADTLVVLKASPAGTSYTADLYVVRTRTGSAGAARVDRREAASLRELAYSLLGLEGDVVEIDRLQRESRRLEAVRAVLAGRRHLERREFTAADAQFERALNDDSLFAAAHHGSALTWFWREAQHWQINRFTMNQSIRRSTAAAVRHSRHIPPEDSEHYHAFDRFQQGQYDSARVLYQRLIRRDSSDAWAWLGLGIVEADDPGTTTVPQGTRRPRGDRTLAIRAFLNAAKAFPLGYGELFDLYLDLVSATVIRPCPGFERDDVTLPWEPRTASNQIFFCPVYSGDSVRWEVTTDWSLSNPQRAAEVANAILHRVETEATRWKALDRTAPGPHEVLNNYWLTRRNGAPRRPTPELAQMFADSAAYHAGQVAALRGDTLLEDFLRLGRAHLAAGQLQPASDFIRRALDRDSGGHDPDRTPPIDVANVFLARGNADDAMPIVVDQWRRTVAMTVFDPVEKRHLEVPPAIPVLARIQVLGAVGRGGGQLRSAFDELHAIWSASSLDDRQIRLMRGNRITITFVAAALLLDLEWLSRWFAGQDNVPPLLQAHLALDTDTAAALGILESLGAARFESAYTAGRLAQRLERHDIAIRHFESMDSAILEVDNFNPGWGLRTLSYLLRARSYEALGQATQAMAAYERFIDACRDGDPALLAESREALERLRSASSLR